MINLIDLKNRIIDDYGKVFYTEDGLCDLLKRSQDIEGLSVISGEWLDKFNHFQNMNDEYIDFDTTTNNQSIIEFDRKNQEQWNIPQEYKEKDILTYMVDKCKTTEEQLRVIEEYLLYEERNLIIVLKALHYIVETLRANNIMIGVGRGSSVSSYCLFILGVHKIDSLKYDLSIKEFLK